MTKTHYYFNCEICGQSYSSQPLAFQCEEKGQPTLVFPRGLVFQLDTRSLFAVKADHILGHIHSLECWEIDHLTVDVMVEIENKLKILTFQKTVMLAPVDKDLVDKMTGFLLGVKALNAILIDEMTWWKKDQPIG